MANLSAGVLSARVRSSGARIEAIDLHLERTLQLLAGFKGKHPADCLRLLPLLFPLCGTAHVLAALQAIEAAAAIEPAPTHASARGTLAMADMLAAAVWRTCIDWAQLAGTPVEPGPVAQARRLVERIALALYPDGDWQRIGGGRLAPDAGALAAVRDELRDLPAQLDQTEVQAALRAPMAAAMSGMEPEWMARTEACFAGMIDATSASFRDLDSQLEAAARLPTTPSSSAALPLQSGHGSGIAVTARGELRYQFDIDSARVLGCRMSAPTDRAFAPDGPVAQLLQRLRTADHPLLAVRWIVAAFDPCIEVRVVAAED